MTYEQGNTVNLVIFVFTWGQFWPSGIVIACVCVCVCVCVSVNHELACMITHHPFKLESPNLDQKCKRPWLRSLLYFGTIDLELQRQIELKSQNLPHYTPCTMKLLGGILVSLRKSVRSSVCPSYIPCPLCDAYSSGRIHFIFIHRIKQLQKVCYM